MSAAIIRMSRFCNSGVRACSSAARSAIAMNYGTVGARSTRSKMRLRSDDDFTFRTKPLSYQPAGLPPEPRKTLRVLRVQRKLETSESSLRYRNAAVFLTLCTTVGAVYAYPLLHVKQEDFSEYSLDNPPPHPGAIPDDIDDDDDDDDY